MVRQAHHERVSRDFAIIPLVQTGLSHMHQLTTVIPAKAGIQKTPVLAIDKALVFRRGDVAVISYAIALLVQQSNGISL